MLMLIATKTLFRSQWKRRQFQVHLIMKSLLLFSCWGMGFREWNKSVFNYLKRINFSKFRDHEFDSLQ